MPTLGKSNFYNQIKIFLWSWLGKLLANDIQLQGVGSDFIV